MKPTALIVVPAYREAARLPMLLADIASHASAFTHPDAPYSIHFRVVDDGSPETESAAMRECVESLQPAGLVSYERTDRNQGKGGAIRQGFLFGLARNFDLLGFVDADCAVSIGELRRTLDYFASTRSRMPLSGVIGSRIRLLGRRVDRSALRHYSGRVFATFVSLVFKQPVYDTQCGLKLFSREALQRHLAAPTDDRWTWDTALLLAMLDAQEPIHEFPIDWVETSGSKLTILDPLKMVWRLMSFRAQRTKAARRANRDVR